MEPCGVAHDEGADQCADFVGVADGKRFVLHQRFHGLQGAGQGAHCLKAEPLFHHQGIAPKAIKIIIAIMKYCIATGETDSAKIEKGLLLNISAFS